MIAAANYLESIISTPITVNIKVGYGEAGGSPLHAGALGETVTESGTYITAAQLKAYLEAGGASQAQAALANVSGDSTRVFITSAQEKAFGILPPTASPIDASVGFAMDPTQTLFTYSSTDRGVTGEYDFFAVALHELTHALGRIASPGVTTALDLFRYAASGVHAAAGTNSYFSIDGGVTNLGNFDTSSDVSDWASSVARDANDAYLQQGVENQFSQADMTELKVLGYSVASSDQSPATSATPVIASGAMVSSGLNAPHPSFVGTAGNLGFSAPTAGLRPGPDALPGISGIAGFRYGLDHLALDLGGMSGALTAFRASVGGGSAIAPAETGDSLHGMVPTGPGARTTVADLMATHPAVIGERATIT